jgi:PAS domain S-box-containing protein
MNHLKKPIATFFMLAMVSAVFLFGQVIIQFKTISVKDGLSLNSVYSIIQDSQGFIWIGTEDGLNRYDGYNFKVYTTEQQNSNSLSHTSVEVIHEGPSGSLWVGTREGLNQFDRSREIFIRYKHKPNDPHSLSHNWIKAVLEDRSGLVWVVTSKGLDQLDQKSGRFIHFRHDPKDPGSLIHNNVNCIHEDSAGVLWLSTSGGLEQFDRGKSRFIHFQQQDPKDPNSLSGIVVSTIYEDGAGVLLIGTSCGLLRFDRQKGQFFHFGPESFGPAVRFIVGDSSNTLWIGTGRGVYKLEKKKGGFVFFNYKNDPCDPTSLCSNSVRTICKDSFGGIWIGTNDGISIYNREKLKFKHYSYDPGKTNGLSGKRVRSICEDRFGNLWLGIEASGLNKLDRKTGQFVHYQADPQNPNSLNSNNAWSIHKDREGVLWVDGSGILSRYDPREDHFIHFRGDPEDHGGFLSGSIWTILEDSGGVMWIGTNTHGLFRFNRENERFFNYEHNPNKPKSLSHNKVRVVFEDSSGGFWVGTHGGGLNQFDRERGEFFHFKHDNNNPTSISHNHINTIHERVVERGKVLWIGTYGGGLNRLDLIKGTFSHFCKKDGLPNNVVYGILEDSKGHLWLSTNKGISRFNPDTREFRNFYVSDGVQSNEFNTGSYFKSKKGEMFFGGINGFNAFFPEDIRDNPYMPIIVITDFHLFNKSVPIGKNPEGRVILSRSISETNALDLSYRDSVLSFEFTALHYVNPENNEYAYMMEGLDEGWNYVGNQRFASYTTLPPGKYTFRVKGSNSDGVWNEKGVSIRINIDPPFWKTWWFRIAGVFLMGFVIVLIYKIRIIQIKNRNIELEKNNLILNSEIAERKNAEKALKESETKYRTLFVSIPDSIIIFHLKTLKILDCNQATIDRYDYTMEELLTMTPFDLHYSEKSEIREIKTEIPRLHNHVTKKGKQLQVQTHTTTVNYKGQPAYISIMRDVSKLKQLEQELFHAQKMESIGQLAGEIAHDFNNLLTAIIGHSELAMLKMEKGSVSKRDIQAVIDSSKGAVNLTSQLLAFSRKQIIKPKVIDINHLILNLEKMMCRLIGENIHLKMILDPGDIRIKADPVQIEQILINLLINARDAVREQPDRTVEKMITIETAKIYVDKTYTQRHFEMNPGLYISIVVSDTGMGMSEEVKNNIFDPFFTTKKEGKGTGLGMATVYGIVKQNFGNIFIYSELTKGTTIKIYWPATSEEMSADKGVKISRKVVSGKETILVVENNEIVRNFTVEALQELGCKVFSAESGKKALALIKERKITPDLMITDLIMPEINGKELAFKLKKISPSTRVIITSGYPDKHILNFEELGKGVHFLPKPYSIQSLVNKINEAMS